MNGWKGKKRRRGRTSTFEKMDPFSVEAGQRRISKGAEDHEGWGRAPGCVCSRGWRKPRASKASDKGDPDPTVGKGREDSKLATTVGKTAISKGLTGNVTTLFALQALDVSVRESGKSM